MRPTVSVVVPVYAGEPHIEQLAASVLEAFEGDTGPALAEILLVLDEPKDRSAEVASRVAREHPDRVEIITLARNFGQHPATVAGVLHSSGDWVATIDEDGQHVPSEILAMVRRAVLDEADLIYGTPRSDVHGGWRDRTSRVAKRLVASLAGIDAARHFNSFRLIRGSVGRAAASVVGHETYFDVALTWHTNRIGQHESTMVDPRPNESNYRFRTLVSHLRRLVISSNPQALRFVALLGLIGVAVAALAMLWLLAGSVFGFRTAERGWLSLITATVFFGGLLTFSVGLLAEYVQNMAQRLQGRPTFHTVDRSLDTELQDWAERGVYGELP